ncbi:DNA cytosine methyltransferase [Micromonospora echinofusca]|uniref:DNA cytosine methyltransferase n=1 Tax=Micromonospora echinofusca TaxID=47858 RepID=UPI003721841B
MTAATPLRAIDLFCGPGGLTQGLKQAKFTVVGGVEQEPIACETYSRNHPEVRLWSDDIRDLSPSAVRTELGLKPGDLDLLAGCPPCQGFSSLRTRNGKRVVDDGRNDLVMQMAVWAAEFRPRAILMENVPALARDYRMDLLVEALEGLGYPARSSYRVVDAQEYGVPQRRRRLVLIAAHKEEIPISSSSYSRQTVRDAIGELPPPGSSGDQLHDLPERRSPKVRDIISRIRKDGGSRKDLGEDQLECHKRLDGFYDIYGRMAWDGPAPTITSGCSNPSKGRFLHPEQDRAISLREAALLQSFPRSYWFSLKGGKEAAALMIGNALPPRLVEAHGTVIRRYLEDRTGSAGCEPVVTADGG